MALTTHKGDQWGILHELQEEPVDGDGPDHLHDSVREGHVAESQLIPVESLPGSLPPEVLCDQDFD